MNDQRELNISLLKVVAEFFLKRNVNFVIVAGHDLNNLESHTETESWLKKIRFNQDGVGDRIAWLKSAPKHFEALYSDLPQYSKEYINNIFTPVPNINTRRGRANLDHKSRYVNVSNGYRHTVGQPEVYDNSIFIVGGSSTYGFGCEDKHTLPSLFQKLINESKFLRNTYSVFNLGARGNPKFVDIYKLLNLNVLPNDIVVLQGVDLDIVKKLSYLRTDMFHFVFPNFSERNNMEELFFDNGHVTYKGHALVAKQLFKNLFFSSSNNKQSKPIRFLAEEERVRALCLLDKFTHEFTLLHSNLDFYPELQHYLDELKLLRVTAESVGAVVVNSNPFTLGHRHLIECAASKMDYLFVFVVEEDLSYFSFKNRLAMVQEGTKDIANVTVVRSGKYIMSTTTCPSYFSREEKQTVELDASTDMDIFGEYIAPILNISVRYVGEEPLCNITNQHNQQMRNILPTYGVRVEVIKRILSKNNIISASLVRNYIQGSAVDRIEDLVPPVTLRHINSIVNT
ncbi:hypothetical protein [Amphritea japonica]|uniref:[citrate (Pro-3S)-lyase] ligase n=1 Tax=Amphritea japonica ATCC BAA-1530 TaxID=1278309 RepID=A0A7R6P3M7_9GAMM|nr:hypothetical protein [Amphritea japonica]BBB26613.1 [citrate (Pro-3S)-lyase] ligase [Amphritea japonica ATCC BAA-1530]